MANYLALNTNGSLTETPAEATGGSGAAANKIPQLDAGGRIPSTMMPTGIGADTEVILASEALTAGDLVNVWSNAGTANVRKADATTAGKEAHGFVMSGVASGASATVYFEGGNASVTGLTPGTQFLSITAGRTTATAPTASGNVVQVVGVAVSATRLNFEAGVGVARA